MELVADSYVVSVRACARVFVRVRVVLLLIPPVQVLRRLSGSVMFFGCFAWNGVNFMYKSQVRQGAAYVGAMALRYVRSCT